MRKARIIYNPLAGSRQMNRTLHEVVALWQQAGWSIDVVQTKRAGDGTRLASEATIAGCELVFAAGGDGTLGEVVNGLAMTETVFAPLPMGTANAFAKELGMPLPNYWRSKRLLAAAQSLLHGVVQRVDLGHIEWGQEENGRYWLLWVGGGADGYIVRKVEPRPPWSKKLGKLGYMLQGIWYLPLLTPFKASICVDREPMDKDVMQFLVSNVRLYAGADMQLCGDSQLDDGQLDIWLFKTRGTLELMELGFKILRQRHHGDKRLERLQGEMIQVKTKRPIFCQTDGDPIGHVPLTVRVCPSALRLLTPPTAPQNLFSLPSEPLF